MLTFYHCPWSRAAGVHWLLEEIGEPYAMEIVDIRGTVPDGYRDIQPNKKVPAIVHDGTVVTERAAICLYLAETFPQAKLAPPVGDPARAAFLTMQVYCDSVFDPAISAKAQGWSYTASAFSFGGFDDMVRYLEKVLSERPYAAGDSFSAVDTQLGSGIHFTMDILHALPDRPVFRDYLTRVQARPAYQRATARDAELATTVTMPPM